MRKIYVFMIICSFVIIKSYAGVMPSQSRIIYEAKDRDKNLMLVNTNNYPVIVQTWIDKGQGIPEPVGIPFVSIPPVFQLDASGITSVKIIYNQDQLPQDKESLFWFNIYEVPPEKKKVIAENRVQLTMDTQIKLFYRPERITVTPEQAVEKVTCQPKGEHSLLCSNPGPVHISVIGVQLINDGLPVEETPDKDLILSPFSQKLYNFRNNRTLSGGVILHYLDDDGNKQEYRLNKPLTQDNLP